MKINNVFSKFLLSITNAVFLIYTITNNTSYQIKT